MYGGQPHLYNPPIPQGSPEQVATHNQRFEESQQAVISAKQLEPSELLRGVSLQSLARSPGREPWKEAVVHPPGSYNSSSNSEDGLGPNQQSVFSIHSITPTVP